MSSEWCVFAFGIRDSVQLSWLLVNLCTLFGDFSVALRV